MKKCIKCELDINDDSIYCPHCGHKQNQEQQKPFNSAAFLRLFRPSFYGGLRRMGITNEQLTFYMFYFLNFTKKLSDDEIKEINRSFYKCLSTTSEEFLVVMGPYNTDHFLNSYYLKKENYESFDDEELRYSFASDKILSKMQDELKGENDNKVEISSKFFAIIWIFSLLSCCNAIFSKENKTFLKRLKMLFPVSRDQFIKSIENSNNLATLSYFSSEARTMELRYLDTISAKIKFINSFITLLDGETLDLGLLKSINYESNSNTLKYTQKNTTEDEYEEEKIIELDKAISDDFDFYQCVENKIKALCECEKQIQELEASEGKYSEIKEQITQLMDKEKTLLDTLTGFVYFNFYL